MAVEDTQSNVPTPRVEIEEPASKVVDEERETHSRRKRLIEEYRERAYRVRTEANSMAISGRLGDNELRRLYRKHVETYLLQTVPLLTRDEIRTDTIMRILSEQPLGEVRFEPPERLSKYAQRHLARLPPGAGVPTPKTVSVVGIQDIVRLPSPLTVEWSVSMQTRDGVSTQTASKQQELPQHILDTAMQLTDKALAAADMGVDIEQQEQQTKIDKKLLEEVEEWRLENV